MLLLVLLLTVEVKEAPVVGLSTLEAELFQERRLAAWFGLTQEENLWVFLEREVGTGVDPPRNPSRNADAKQAVEVWNSSCGGAAWAGVAANG